MRNNHNATNTHGEKKMKRESRGTAYVVVLNWRPWRITVATRYWSSWSAVGQHGGSHCRGLAGSRGRGSGRGRIPTITRRPQADPATDSSDGDGLVCRSGDGVTFPDSAVPGNVFPRKWVSGKRLYTHSFTETRPILSVERCISLGRIIFCRRHNRHRDENFTMSFGCENRFIVPLPSAKWNLAVTIRRFDCN